VGMNEARILARPSRRASLIKKPYAVFTT